MVTVAGLDAIHAVVIGEHLTDQRKQERARRKVLEPFTVIHRIELT